MSTPNTDVPLPSASVTIKQPKVLRVWPGIVAVVLQWFAWLVLPVLFPAAGIYGLLGLPLGALAVIVWWFFFSRAAWIERIGALVLLGLAPFITKLFVHPSISNG